MSDRRERSWKQVRLYEIAVVRDLIWVAVAATVICTGYYLRSIVTPVLIAFFLAYLFDPLIRWAGGRWKLSRLAVTSILLATMIIGGGLMLWWLGPLLVNQLIDLGTQAPKYLQNIADRMEIDLAQTKKDVAAWAEEIKSNPTGELFGYLRTALTGTGTALGVVGTVIGTVTYIAMVLFLIPLCFFFFAWHFDQTIQQMRVYIPAGNRPRILELIRRMDACVAIYFRSRVVIAVIMGVLLSVGWAIGGVPYWFLLGMGSGLISVVPYATFVGWPLAIGLTWLDSTSGANAGAAVSYWHVMIWPTIVFLVVQGLEGAVLTPLIQGAALNMGIITVLLAVLMGGALGGLYGLILAIPLTACLRILLSEVFLPRLKKWAAEN